jgi:hypothetical protein
MCWLSDKYDDEGIDDLPELQCSFQKALLFVPSIPHTHLPINPTYASMAIAVFHPSSPFPRFGQREILVPKLIFSFSVSFDCKL